MRSKQCRQCACAFGGNVVDSRPTHSFSHHFFVITNLFMVFTPSEEALIASLGHCIAVSLYNHCNTVIVASNKSNKSAWINVALNRPITAGHYFITVHIIWLSSRRQSIVIHFLHLLLTTGMPMQNKGVTIDVNRIRKLSNWWLGPGVAAEESR